MTNTEMNWYSFLTRRSFSFLHLYCRSNRFNVSSSLDDSDRTRRKRCKFVIAGVLFIFIRILSGWCGVGRMSLTAVIGWERERGLLGNSSEEEQSATAASQSRRMISRADVPAHTRTHARSNVWYTHTGDYSQGHLCFHSSIKHIISHNYEIETKLFFIEWFPNWVLFLNISYISSIYSLISVCVSLNVYFCLHFLSLSLSGDQHAKSQLQ